MTVKRCREEDKEVEALAMANCLMLLSNMAKTKTTSSPLQSVRVFSCKTCNKQFQSFQALGGHRAGHKRAKLLAANDDQFRSSRQPAKPKTHECSICGLEFPLGQALGGHMRRHRNDSPTKSEETESGEQKSQKSNNHSDRNSDLMPIFDLNLTPYENHLKFGM